MPGRLRTSALISFIFVLPFMILEWINRRGFNEGFPLPLFGLMWFLPFVFILILMPILQSQPGGHKNWAQLRRIAPRIVLLALIAWLWVGLLLDQMPCFLGVPLCD